jgi:hypothetical protein
MRYNDRLPSLLMKAAQSAAEADGLRPIKKENDAKGQHQGNGNGNGANKNALAMAAAQAQLVAQQRQQQQQRKTSSSSSAKKKGQQLRRGKWTPEEESYANRLIQEFKAGLLPLTDGTTLRTFLSKLLNCDPMRISKKFVGSNCIGKQVFRRRTADLNRLTPEQIQKSRAELSELERRFLERVAQTNRVKNSSAVGGGAGSHQNTHMHNQNLHNQHRQHVGVSHQHHNAVVSAALSAAAAANVPMHRGMSGGNGNFMNGNRNSMSGMHQNPPWMQPPMGYKQGLGAQMARDNLAAGGQGNSRTAAAGRALLDTLGGGGRGGDMGGNNHNGMTKSGINNGGNGMPHGSSSGMMAMAELQRRASLQFGNHSAQNLLAALSGGNSNQSLAHLARNASGVRMGGANAGGNSFNNLMMKSGFSRDQLSQLARDRGLSSASLSNMVSGLDGRKNSFDQLMSLDFQSLQSIDNLANLIQTGGGQGQAPSSGMKNWSADQTGGQGGHVNGHGGNRLSSTASLSNAARRLASQNNFESLMRNLSSNNNMNQMGSNNDDYGNGGGGNSSDGNNGQPSNANLQSLLQSMNSNGGGNTSMSSLLRGNNASAASLANLLRADNSSTGLSALRNSDGLNGRNTTSVEDFLSLMAAGDIPHQDPAVLNLPLSQLQQQQQLNNSNNNNNGDHQGGDGNNNGGTSNSEQAANILAQATGNSALANALASRSFGSNLGSFADMSRAAGAGSNLQSLGSTAELLQQLADASGGGGSSNSLSNMKRKLLDVDGGLDSQGMNKR